MNDTHEIEPGATAPVQGPLRRFWRQRRIRALAAVALVVCAGAVAMAQVVAPTQAPTYCYNRSTTCNTTLDQAEAVMRADPFFQGAGDAAEQIGTAHINPTTLWMQYAVVPRPATSVGVSAYWGDYGAFGNSQGSCTLSEDQTVLPGWCATEEQVVNIALQRILASRPTCTLLSNGLNPNVSSPDYNDPFLGPVINQPYGRIDYDSRMYRTVLSCAGGTTAAFSWFVLKQRPLHCRTGFKAMSIAVNEASVAQDNLCEGREDDVVRIATPIRQCGGCAGSPNPIYPTTGEKRRAESDFVFAGEAFTRHYRSLRQYRNSRKFAIAWSHTWSDRILGGATSTTPYIYINDAGDYEGYTTIATNRYRGENSVDRVLERVNANGIGWRLRFADGEVREFDLNGYLSAVRHPDAPLQDVTVVWVDKAVSTVTDAQGRVLRFFYVSNLLQRIVLPDGSEYVYGHDANGNLTSVLKPDWSMRVYHYNEAGLSGAADQRHQLTGITDEFSQRIGEFSYDARGRVTASRMLGSPNELTQISYPNEDAATIQTADGGSDAYLIQSGTYRRILSLADSGGSHNLSYDPEGRVLSSTDKRGIVTRYEYTGAYRTATMYAFGLPEQRREEVDRDPVSGRVTALRVLDAAGALKARTVWTYNARHQPLTVSRIDPASQASRTITLSYCEQADVTAGSCPLVGLLKTIDGPRADVTDAVTYTYRMADEATCAATPTACPYRKGDLWKIVNALGHTVEIIKNDGAGRPKSMADANGVVTDLEYNIRGWLTAKKIRGANDASESDDRITRLYYFPFGAIKRVLESDGAEAVFAYDASQRLVSVGDNRGNLIVYTLDAAGNVVGEDVADTSGTLRRSLDRTFDTLGRLQSTIDAYGRVTGFGYDTGDQLKRVTDALGRKSDQDLDPLGRPFRSVQDVDGIAAETRYGYDTLDRLTRVTDPKGLFTDYAYNGFDELVQRISPDTDTSSYAYDAAGNRIGATDARGIVTGGQYDVLNRPVAVDLPGTAEDVTYQYDTPSADCAAGETFHAGRLSRMTDASGSTTWCYGRFGDLVRKVQRTGATTLTLRWNVLANGRLASMTYPDGTVVDYVRDSLGRTTGIGATPTGGTRQTLLSGAIYHPFGPAAQWTYGNGRVITRTLNQNGQPGIVQDTAAGGISIGYQFDEVGNLKTLRNGNQADPPLRRYDYDGLNRLTGERDGASLALLQGYAYDATGNRTSRTAGATTETYAYPTTSHRLQRVAGIARSYDDIGNTTSIGGSAREFVYNQAGRMSSAKANGVQTASYRYNGSGERVEKTASGQTVVTLYGGAGQWLGDYDSNGQPLQQVMWFNGLPTGLLTGTAAGQKLLYIEADALGSPRVVIDPVRNVAVWRWDLSGNAFGADLPNQDPDNDGAALVFDLRFPGQRYDAATGLMHNYFRDYDASVGRYVQSDPIGLAGGINTYAYAGGSPLNGVDPLGLASCFVFSEGCRFNPRWSMTWEQAGYGAAAGAAIAGTIIGGIATVGILSATASDAMAGGALYALGNNYFGLLFVTNEVVAGSAFAAASGGMAPMPTSNLASVGARLCGTPSGKFYSVAYQMRLKSTSYPGVSRGAHFQEANEDLLKAMEADPDFAAVIRGMDIDLKRTPTGLAPRVSPQGWTWHHAVEPGVMQLVPRPQHAPGSIFQGAFHPGGVGGYSLWGKP